MSKKPIAVLPVEDETGPAPIIKPIIPMPTVSLRLRTTGDTYPILTYLDWNAAFDAPPQLEPRAFRLTMEPDVLYLCAWFTTKQRLQSHNLPYRSSFRPGSEILLDSGLDLVVSDSEVAYLLYPAPHLASLGVVCTNVPVVDHHVYPLKDLHLFSLVQTVMISQSQPVLQLVPIMRSHPNAVEP